MEHGFSRNQRILAAADYKRVFDQPAWRFSTKHVLLLARPGEQSASRLGLVVSKKNAGCSVKRNRVKRLCREAFRLHGKDFATIDLILLARPGISDLDNPAITTAISSLLDKLSKASANRPATPASP
jgi:ribonuclease P protein component